MRLKVLALTNLFPSAWDPGRAAFNRQQFEGLRMHHDVDVMVAVDFRQYLAGRRGDPELGEIPCRHFVFFYPPGFGRSLHAGFWLVSLLMRHGLSLRRQRFDCLLASWAYPDAVAVAWLAGYLGIPYAVKVHGSDLNVQATFAPRRRQIRGALRGAGAVVTVSGALADKVCDLGVDSECVHTLYNGVDTELFSPGSQAQARQRLGLPDATPLLLYVGNLKVSKGCVDLLEAFATVVERQPTAHLVFVGDGPCRNRLLARSDALGIGDQVQLTGALEHAGLADWFRAADVLCLPSHDEGVPNVVLEAMACGTPVVASRVGGLPEVVPDYAGILVPARDRNALAAALIDSGARNWESSRIVEHAQGFRWDDNVQQLADILRDVAASPPPDNRGSSA